MVAGRQRDVRAGVERRGEIGEDRGVVGEVGVEPGDVVTAGGEAAGLQRGAEAQIVWVDQDRGVRAAVELRAQAVPRGIGRTVVDEDEIDAALGAGGEAVQRGCEVRDALFFPVQRDDDGERGQVSGPLHELGQSCWPVAGAGA